VPGYVSASVPEAYALTLNPDSAIAAVLYVAAMMIGWFSADAIKILFRSLFK
jgi:hypothetical protein